jgi:hypothetical protein
MNVIFIRQVIIVGTMFGMTKQIKPCPWINSSEHSNYRQVPTTPRMFEIFNQTN